MDMLKALNVLVRFLLELCMLAAVGYWGFEASLSWGTKIILGIGLPALIAAGWWLAWRLRGTSRTVLALALLSSGAVALFAVNRPDLGWTYTTILVINKTLMIIWKQ